ncbi:MAG: hypothetical protein A4E30_01425 [Methanomassiliicoccales archaeon PtaB.Bin215]|nr:MAG: hypothetical protein A4E30_01425 [Methanomassiliicoccales archaeon PtaB.Bin215]
MDLNDFLASENGPPWLPASVAEARKLVYIGQLFALIFTLIALLAGVISIITGNLGGGISSLVAAGLGVVLLFMLKDQVFANLDQGRFKQASDSLLIWTIVGFFVYVIPGLIMLFGFLKLQDIFQPQYQQYQAQQYQVAQEQPQQAPPAPQPAPQPAPAQPAPAPEQPAQTPAEHKDKKVEMAKCRKCGVNFPAFMHNCPNCNEPRH